VVQATVTADRADTAVQAMATVGRVDTIAPVTDMAGRADTAVQAMATVGRVDTIVLVTDLAGRADTVVLVTVMADGADTVVPATAVRAMAMVAARADTAAPVGTPHRCPARRVQQNSPSFTSSRSTKEFSQAREFPDRAA